MPKLKLTYTQIKEQAARDIRNRTAARLAQLHRTAERQETRDLEERKREEEDTEHRGFSFRAQLFFLFLLLLFLLYHAGKQTKKV